MSYYASICFKKLPAERIHPFFQELKAASIEKMPEIAKNNFSYCPYIRNAISVPENFADISIEARREAEEWAKTSVFTHRWFYDPEFQLLGVYSIDDSLHFLFDKEVYFQNSTDQDYPRKDWEGIPEFETIYDKWAKLTPEEIVEKYNEKNPKEPWEVDHKEVDAEGASYYARTYAYEEIWSRYDDTLYDDNSVVYLSLFGYYDVTHLLRFVKLCHEAEIADQKEWESKRKNK